MNSVRSGNIIRGMTLALVLCLLSATVMASEHQSLASIYSTAKRFMQKQVDAAGRSDARITTGKLDSRLKLRKCTKPLQASMSRGAREIGNTSVGIKCTDNKPWSINLPVRVDVYRNVLVSTRQLSRGDPVAAGDIELASRNLAELSRGYLDDYDACLGMTAKRRILPGTALTPAMLKKPQLVSRGQRVTILADTGRMQVRMTGKALAGGAAGDRIQVQNISSERRLEGVITAAGEVKVDI